MTRRQAVYYSTWLFVAALTFYLLFNYVIGDTRFYWPAFVGAVTGMMVGSVLMYVVLSTVYPSKLREKRAHKEARK